MMAFNIRDILNKPREFLRKIHFFNRRTGTIVQGTSVGPNENPNDLELLDDLDVQILSFKAVPAKIKKDSGDKARLFWDTDYANRIVITSDNGVLYDRTVGDNNKSGNIEVTPSQTTTYQIRAYNDVSELAQVLVVSVLETAKIISFSSDKEYVLPHVPFTINWDVTNALKVEFDGGRVNAISCHFFSDGIEDEKAFVLKVTDDFGTISQSIRVRLLPMPIIKSILVPTPSLECRMNVVANMPISFMDGSLEIPHNITQSIKEIEKITKEIPQITNSPIINLPKFDIPKTRMEKLDCTMKECTNQLMEMLLHLTRKAI
ncbi:MAG: hypothetical protein IJU90_07240 [Bacteroidales bacterium]|nr:hypothetical protein [Bacteroidales bacterium]